MDKLFEFNNCDGYYFIFITLLKPQRFTFNVYYFNDKFINNPDSSKCLKI